MRRVIALMIGVLIALVGIPAAAQAASPGFSVSGGKIYDANGARFIPQGINHAHTWYPDELDSLAAIRAAGANTVRVVDGAHRNSPELLIGIPQVAWSG